MSTYFGDCFVVLPPCTEGNAIIYGRNCIRPEGEVQEVVYFPPNAETGCIKSDGGAIVDRATTLGVILSRTAGSWGAETGANEMNVSVGITWSEGEPTSDSVKSTDLIRLALECSNSAEEAIESIASLVSTYGSDSAKFSFIICDTTAAWLLNIIGKIWAAEKITSGFRRIRSPGLAIKTKIDKSVDELVEKVKGMGLWDGNEPLDLAKSFSLASDADTWTNNEPCGDGSFTLTAMFEMLRSTGDSSAASSHVALLLPSRISCQWFTATPNPVESVFKPFVFGPGARISPLTIKQADECTTLLYKLHSQRNWHLVGNLLRSLELTCVEEVKRYLSEHPLPSQELDELMKDCVEAEVKFYR